MVSRQGRLLGLIDRMFSMEMAMISRVRLDGVNGSLRALWNISTTLGGKEWRKMMHSSVRKMGG